MRTTAKRHAEGVRAIMAAPRWRWEVGMVDEASGRVVCWTDPSPGGVKMGDGRVRPDNGPLPHDARPDFSHAGTRALILDLMGEGPRCKAHSPYICAGLSDTVTVRCGACSQATMGRGRDVYEAIARGLGGDG